MFKQTVVFAFLLAGVFADDNTEALKQVMREKIRPQCERAGAPDKVEEATNAFVTFMSCAANQVNMEQLQRELAGAHSSTTLDRAFSRICSKSSELKTCFQNLAEGFRPCLESTVRQELPSLQRGAFQAIDYLCYNGGHRLTLFIIEQGPQCIGEKESAIISCVSKLEDATQTMKAGRDFSDTEQCAIVHEVSTCVVNVLKQCPGHTTREMAESLFNYLLEHVKCTPVSNKSSTIGISLLVLSTVLLL